MRFALPALAAVLGLVALLTNLAAQSPSTLPHRASLPAVARDAALPPPPTPTPIPTPPPGPGYCGPSTAGVPFPPNAVFGLLTIGGVPAPAGTTVYLTFDGQPGPGVYTTDAGGYRVRYAGGGQGHVPRCINEVGSEMGILVAGVTFNSGVLVGDPVYGLALRFDVAVP